MEPSKVASSLREIADRLDRSSKPDRTRVSAAIRGVLAGMDDSAVSVLEKSVMVDVPGLGEVPVVIKRMDLFAENKWSGVTGTINGIPASTSGGKNRPEQVQVGKGLESLLDDDFRVVDAFTMAVHEILKAAGWTEEFPTVEKGVHVPHEYDEDATTHEDGDPATDGYKFQMGPATGDDSQKKMSLDGTIHGKKVSGILTVHLISGGFGGYDYDPKPGSFDPSSDPEAFMDPILEAASGVLGL